MNLNNFGYDNIKAIADSLIIFKVVNWVELLQNTKNDMLWQQPGEKLMLK